METDSKDTIIEVQSYSGYKADERPVSFILDGTKLMVEKIIDRWYSPDCEYFKVLADQGKQYLLKCQFNGIWTVKGSEDRDGAAS